MNFDSYRFRIPASLALAVLISTFALSLVIAWQTYINVGAQQQREGTRLAHAMTPLLARALKHDDVWLAYSVLRGPDAIALDEVDTRSLVLLDNQLQVFASNRPRIFPVNQSLDSIVPGMPVQIENVLPESNLLRYDNSQFLVHKIRSIDEGDQIGLLLQEIPRSLFWARIWEIIKSASWAISIILLILVGLGWLWGSRIVSPIMMLSSCMQRVRQDDIDEIQCPAMNGRDELSELGRTFYHLLADLKTKKALEAQVMTQERLAAIGQVAAGVAHEINNPLGGLLTSIDTYKLTPLEKRQPDRLMAFISRGLEQIRESVGALLVESKLETRVLTPQDINDVEKLARASAEPNGKRIHWDNRVQSNLPLPATPIRQVLLNLLLNAIQATTDPQDIEVEIYVDENRLIILTCNLSDRLSERALAQMFEPFKTGHAGGTGLGLWITYQTITQLGGEISVEQKEGLICFHIELPLDPDNTGEVAQ